MGCSNMSKNMADGIVFIGHMGAGKSYFLERFIKEWNKLDTTPINRVSIASNIKEIATNYFGMKDKDRTLLQSIGSKMREVDREVWIKALMLKIANNNLVPFGIDDVRFLNELKMIKSKYNVIVVKLEQPEQERLNEYKKLYGRFPTTEELTDRTEAEIDSLPFDYLIVNNYSPEDFKQHFHTLLTLMIS